MSIELIAAVQSYWDVREAQAAKQALKGSSDTGTRSSVTGGQQMSAMEHLVVSLIKKENLPDLKYFTRSKLELPGYFRPEKKWDLIVISKQRLVCAIEFKSMVGPSFGNNFNNRTEEAIGNSVDIWTAFREGRFGSAPKPFLGFYFLLEDCETVHKPVKAAQPHFKTDPEFIGASYAKRYELLCRRLVRERHYDATCLTLATKGANTKICHPAEDIDFDRFIRALLSSARQFQ